MTGPLLDATQRHPLTLPDGQIYTNSVYLNQVIDHPNIEIGDYTYYNDFEPVSDYAARIAPYLHAGAPEKLIIGKFGQFAHGIRFITSSADHPKDWFTTYPFAVFNAQTMPLFEAEFSKGEDTIIGNDVWIGHGAIVLPGASIGDGAIIGAGAVVKGEVPAYSVFGGNPAKQIKQRFDNEIIALLTKLQWWDLPIAEIEKILPVLASRDFDMLQKIVEEL